MGTKFPVNLLNNNKTTKTKTNKNKKIQKQNYIFLKVTFVNMRYPEYKVFGFLCFATSQMNLWVKTPAMEPDNQSSIPRTHMVGRENGML